LHNDAQLQALVRDRLGVRIGTEMSKYLARRLAASSAVIPIMGADARTGAAVKRMIDPQLLIGDSNSAPPPRQDNFLV
jgi:hypothetical protein